MLKDKFLDIMQARHACKLFDDTKKIENETMETILQIGRLSPSSFGMEPWRFLVIREDSFKAALRPLCWDQPQITTCSHLVVIKAIVGPLAPGSTYREKMLSRRELPKEKIEAYLNIYDKFASNKMATEGLFCWSSRQCYIAAANMMTGAKAMGIDSCPIEGFEKEKIEALLQMDPAEEQLALIIPFGYCVRQAKEKIRLPLEEITEYR